MKIFPAATLLRSPLQEGLFLLVVSSLWGIAWNASVLHPPAAATAAAETVISPLPLGLEQVAELAASSEAILIDARDGGRYAAGHLPGAISVPAADMEQGLALLRRTADSDTALVVYCSGEGCSDSHKVAKRLLRQGYGAVYVYDGGFPEWEGAGRPVEK